MLIQNQSNSSISSHLLVKYEIPYRLYHVKAKEQVISSTRANMIHPSLPDWFLYEYQVKVINLNDKNVLHVSGTGSGKTETVHFHIFKNIAKDTFRQVLAVYPTNILAQQQFECIDKYAKLFNLNASFLSGATASKSGSKDVEIITTNPTFILDQMLSIKLYNSFPQDFKDLKYILFDEIHIYKSR